MNPTPAAIDAIRARVSDWTPADAEIAAALNLRDTPNPAPAARVPRPLTTGGLLAKLAAPVRAKLANRPMLAQIVLDIRAQDRAAVMNWAQMLEDAGDFTAADKTAVWAECQATIPDPAHLPQLSWAELNLGRLADTDDIAKARP